MEIMLREVLWSINNRLEEVVKALQVLDPNAEFKRMQREADDNLLRRMKATLPDEGGDQPPMSGVLKGPEVSAGPAAHTHYGMTVLHKMAQVGGITMHTLHGTYNGDCMEIDWEGDPCNTYRVDIQPVPRRK